MKNQIIRLPEVIERTALSRSTIYALIKSGNFPQQIQLGLRSVGWVEQEINDWIKSRVKVSRKDFGVTQ